MEKRVLELDQNEHKAIVNIINEKRTSLINENKSNDFITEILEKALNAPYKKKSIFSKKEKNNER